MFTSRHFQLSPSILHTTIQIHYLDSQFYGNSILGIGKSEPHQIFGTKSSHVIGSFLVTNVACGYSNLVLLQTRQ